MDNSGQAEFIGRIKRALGHPHEDLRRMAKFFDLPISENDRIILEHIKNRTRQRKQSLLETLIEAAEPINLNVIVLPDVSAVTSAIVDLVGVGFARRLGGSGSAHARGKIPRHAQKPLPDAPAV